LISQEILEQINFIYSGSFTETGGEPVLRIVGDVQPAGPIITPDLTGSRYEEALNSYKLVQNFLEQQDVNNGRAYVEAFASAPAKWLPIFFYLYSSALSISEARDIISTLQGISSTTRNQKLSRIESEKFSRNLGSGNNADVIRFLHKIQNGEVVRPQNEYEGKMLVRALMFVSENDISLQNALEMLSFLHDDYREVLHTELRKAICYIDYLFFYAYLQ